jgi:catechol 2,3-dioxygenase-like lactoylglutathione lyase family enzyme
MTAPCPGASRVQTPGVISKVDHTGITVSSLKDAIAFWVDVLGFQHLYTWEFETTPFIENLLGVDGAEISLAMVEGYGHRVELIEYQAPPNRETMKPRSCDVGSVHIGFYVDDMDAALARVSQAQWWPVAEPQTVRGGDRDGMRLIYVRGPDGITIEFMQKAREPDGGPRNTQKAP